MLADTDNASKTSEAFRIVCSRQSRTVLGHRTVNDEIVAECQERKVPFVLVIARHGPGRDGSSDERYLRHQLVVKAHGHARPTKMHTWAVPTKQSDR